KQINRSIELIRYRRFGSDLLMIELAHNPRVAARPAAPAEPGGVTPKGGAPAKDPYLSQRIDYRLSNASPDLRDVWDSVVDFVMSLGDDVQMKEVKFYGAIKRIENFVCLEIFPQARTVPAFL